MQSAPKTVKTLLLSSLPDSHKEWLSVALGYRQEETEQNLLQSMKA